MLHVPDYDQAGWLVLVDDLQQPLLDPLGLGGDVYALGYEADLPADVEVRDDEGPLGGPLVEEGWVGGEWLQGGDGGSLIFRVSWGRSLIKRGAFLGLILAHGEKYLKVWVYMWVNVGVVMGSWLGLLLRWMKGGG